MAEARTREMHPKRVGERLAEARAAQKLELEDIAERTRIPLRHLQAIEASNFDALPASTYSVGFAKTFARTVGLDGNEIATAFRAERGETMAERLEYRPFEPADPSRVPPSLLAMVAIGTAIVLLVAYLIWRGGGANEERQQMAAGTLPEATAPAVPAPAAPQPGRATSVPPPVAASSANDKVVLIAGDSVWVKVSERGGPTLYMGELAPGQRYEVPVDAKDPVILTGRPDVLRAQIGATVIPALGSARRTIVDVSLKAPALIERDAAMKATAAPPPAAPVEGIDRSGAANANQASPAVETPVTP